MNDKLKKIMDKIGISDEYLKEFKNASLNKNRVDDLDNIVYITINNDDDISFTFYDELVTKFTSYFDGADIFLNINNETRNSTHFKENFDETIKNCKDAIPLIDLILSKTEFLGNSLTTKAINVVEKADFINDLDSLKRLLGSYGTNFTYEVFLDDELKTKLNNDLDNEIKEIENTKFVHAPAKPVTMFPRRRKHIEDERTIFGNLIPEEDEIWKIRSLTGEKDSVVIEGKVFGTEEFTPASKAFKILTLKVNDDTDSILCKVFIRDDEVYDKVLKKTKKGTYLKLKGSLKIDQYSNNELVLNVYDIYESDKKDAKRVDTAPIKRVELHAHTMMSQMDGVTRLDLDKHTCELITRCISMGYKGVAVTDHSGCQAFPIVFELISGYNKDLIKGLKKSKEELETKKSETTDEDLLKVIDEDIDNINKELENPKTFKGLYGTELTLVDDTVDIVIRPTSDNLIESTYVVFDTETTGFNAGGKDQMIEIGAVKLCNGEIIDRFDELIDPKRPVPEKITKLTGITDAMVSGKDDEEAVTKKFLEWTGDLPLVAHNAKFDISFLTSAMRKYDLGELKNTVIDTLELSRTLDQGEARHSLSAITKRYKVAFDENDSDSDNDEQDGNVLGIESEEKEETKEQTDTGSHHHRADYDAEATAKVYAKMMLKLKDQNIKKIKDIDKLVSKDEIYKFGRTYHFNAIAINKTGLKNLFKIISLANTVYLYKTPRILRSKLNELREGILIGSGCAQGEVFLEATRKEGEELTNIINFYDYVEVQPPEVYSYLIDTSDFKDEDEVKEHIKKIINATKEAGKIIVATGDVHHFDREDKIYREVIINQKVPGGGRHHLNRKEISVIPSQHFRTTDEMLEDFSFLDKDVAYEIVVTNTNKVLDMTEVIEVIPDTKGIPFSPRVKSDDGESYLDCPKVVTELVFNKAKEWYGEPLPYNIEERIAKELYGDIVYKCYSDTVREKNPTIKQDKYEKEVFKKIHETVSSGYDKVKEELFDYLKKKLSIDNPEITDEEVTSQMKKELGGIIGGGFDPIYLIAQRLVKHSNDEGFLVGSRGSVGSSFVATMMGITEVNPLPAHYRCLKCKTSIFEDDDGNSLGATYSSGFDLPDKKCPNCGEALYKDGQDMPFATFLGFNADKVPDIDLNFSDLNQASAHEYTKVLFGVDNVYRAGTIGTVADKTAYGFVLGYLEDKMMEQIDIVCKKLDKSYEELLDVEKKEKPDKIAKKFLLLQDKIKSEIPFDFENTFNDVVRKIKALTSVRSAEIERISLGCVGVKRTTGQHPGGIVVVPDYKDLEDFTPCQFPADDASSAWRTTHFSYHAIDQCLLKLDILGHSDPTQLRMIQDLTKMDIKEVPLDDKDTMSIFTSTKVLGVTNEQILCPTGTLGIPEFGTNFTISMVEDTKPKSFGELIKISGLSHGTDVWLGNAQELIKNNVVPFKEVIGCRDDIMVYLMYHGVEPIKAFKIMEFVRKGKASKDPETWKGHVETMRKAGIEDWFIESCHKIKYMFPKAHAAAYVISAFRIAWFKVHMPVYFYASWLTSKATDTDIAVMMKGYDEIRARVIEIKEKGFDATNKETGQLESLWVCLEAAARGIKFAPVDLLKSEANTWGVLDDETILPPFSSIDGLGDTVAKAIVEEREKRAFTSIEDLQKRAKISGTLIDKLKRMHILDSLDESDQLTLF